MKKIILISLLLMIAGCSFLDQATKDAVECRKDPVCYEMVKGRSDLAKDLAGTVNPIAGSVVGAITLAFGLWLGGKKKREDK